VRLVRVAEQVHPSLPSPMRGGEVQRDKPRRPLPPPRCVQRGMVSTPSGCAPSAAPTRVPRAEFHTGSVAELHRDLFPDLEDEESVEITFTDCETDDPTQRMTRRSSAPPPPSVEPPSVAPESIEPESTEPVMAEEPSTRERVHVRESAIVESGQAEAAQQQRRRADFGGHGARAPRDAFADRTPERIPQPRAPLPTIVVDPEPEPSGPGETGDRHARIPEPPAPEPLAPEPTVRGTPIVPAIRVAIYTARDGTPQLSLHQEGDPVGAPTAVLVPDCREDALRILQLFQRSS
jgi:hypothetical protein